MFIIVFSITTYWHGSKPITSRARGWRPIPYFGKKTDFLQKQYGQILGKGYLSPIKLRFESPWLFLMEHHWEEDQCYPSPEYRFAEGCHCQGVGWLSLERNCRCLCQLSPLCRSNTTESWRPGHRSLATSQTSELVGKAPKTCNSYPDAIFKWHH